MQDQWTSSFPSFLDLPVGCKVGMMLVEVVGKPVVGICPWTNGIHLMAHPQCTRTHSPPNLTFPLQYKRSNTHPFESDNSLIGRPGRRFLNVCIPYLDLDFPPLTESIIGVLARPAPKGLRSFQRHSILYSR